ncbi:MAG: Fur family transcriptional regulator [Acidimicrobiia bacterium]|nr:Fur family transcriptional regulator [Acidimicrobiia bacterium]
MSREPADLLREHGLQVTAQRIAVLQAVSARPHGTADEISDEVRSAIGSISRQAVYDSLATLAAKHLIRRIQPAGSAARFEDRVADNHHHLVCRTCNEVVDVDCATGSAPCLTASDDHGYDIDEAEVVYWGQCRDCAEADHKSNRDD